MGVVLEGVITHRGNPVTEDFGGPLCQISVLDDGDPTGNVESFPIDGSWNSEFTTEVEVRSNSQAYSALRDL